MNKKIQSYFTRPHRQTYYPYDLGSPVLNLHEKVVNRTDFFLHNRNNHKITVSFYQTEQQICQTSVLYLHTHHGSKLEGLYLIQPLIKANYNVCLFDFAGYGNSEGQTVTMGVEQVWDIELVTQHLKKEYQQKSFVLWGRSMGAVAALLYLYKFNENKKILAGVFDSPFHSLQKLTLEIGSKTSGFPQALLKPIVFLLKKTLEGKISFQELQLLERIESIKVPGIFITSKQDKFVNYEHSQVLYEKYKGKKQLYYIEQDHNQPRKVEDLRQIFNFLNKMGEPVEKKSEKILENNLQFMKKYGKELHKFNPEKVIFYEEDEY